MPSNLNLDYYYGTEADQYSFYRIPKILLTDPRYRNVSIESKVLYGLLLDRMGLSVKNGWMDSDRRVYIYFTQEDAMSLMSCGKDKTTKLFRELEVIGLIERKKQGQGRPTRIYVKNFTLPPDPSQPQQEPQTSPFPGPNQFQQGPQTSLPPVLNQFQQGPQIPPFTVPSPFQQGPQIPPLPVPSQPQQGPQTPPPPASQTADFPQSRPLDSAAVKTAEKPLSAPLETRSLDSDISAPNKTDKNNTDLNDTETSILPPTPSPFAAPLVDRTKRRMRMDEMDRYRERIKENIDFDLLLDEHPYDRATLEGYVELMVEVCCSCRDFIRIAGEEVSTGVVKDRFLKLNYEHITYVLDSLSQNTTLVKKIKAYTLAALYNAPATIGQYYASQASHDLAWGAAGT